MDHETSAAIGEVFQGSNEGRLHFGQVVQRLSALGVESYAVDYRARRATYCLANDETVDFELHAPEVAVGQAFDLASLRAAIRGAQQGAVMYPAFKRITQAAGCIGYTAWLAGRHVTYFGRRGETHVEVFPD